jgi:[acyl-carrier-protein] S-malonyltransferase
VKLAYVFPGQGAQYVGMGRDFIEKYPAAKELFERADEVLGFSLTELCLNGPEEELKLTYHTQPALLVTSIAAVTVFRQHTDVEPVALAGHSLGEYSALVAAGALRFEDAVKLVHLRGRLMDEAVPAGTGTMAAVLGMEEDDLKSVCNEASDADDVVEVANLNCPGQIVISGTVKAVERASHLAKEAGAKRVIPLVVSGPFHSSLMKPAADRLETLLSNIQVSDANYPVVANVDAKPYQNGAIFPRLLKEQLYSPVRWADDVRTMLELGVEGFIEFGPGTVLSGLIKKVERRIPTFHVEDEASLHETIQALGC